MCANAVVFSLVAEENILYVILQRVDIVHLIDFNNFVHAHKCWHIHLTLCYYSTVVVYWIVALVMPLLQHRNLYSKYAPCIVSEDH